LTNLIVIPMKDLSECKTRLASCLGEKARSDLARLLYIRTLEFITPIALENSFDVAVVTNSSEAINIASAFKTQIIEEPPFGTLSTAVNLASEWACINKYHRFCVIPADLVAPDQQEMKEFLHSKAIVTICPSVDQGTNALMISPPNAIEFHYGHRSSIAHFNAAMMAGLKPVLMPFESLSFDLDHTDCLDRAFSIVPEFRDVCK
tara:strand:- start:953 stop:1567 length:615 start_codon:yes stop_codon:yes gene_type:complete